MTTRICCLASLALVTACTAGVTTSPAAGGGGTTGGPGTGGTRGGGTGGGSGIGTDANCGLLTVKLERKPPEMVLVFDRSSSMNTPLPGVTSTRFDEASVAIYDVLAKTNDTVMWGLKLFPTGEQCGITAGIDVPVGARTAMAVTTSIMGLPPGDPTGTPTHLAVTEASNQLKARTTDNPKYILLTTDGEPTCAGGGPAPSVAAVTAAAAAGFHTFVVGIATAGTSGDGVLNDMAIAGGEARAGATKYYPASLRTELVAALTQITGQVTNCVYPLGKQPPSPDDVAVKVGATRIGRDPGNGWSYGGAMGSVVLMGAACDLAKSGSAGEVSIIFGCPGMVIP